MNLEHYRPIVHSRRFERAKAQRKTCMKRLLIGAVAIITILIMWVAL